MSENKLKDILGETYTEDPIINFLKYRILGEKTYPKHGAMEERNQWRRKYDLDVVWLDGDLNADTIFSLWVPLKMCLQYLAASRFKRVGPRNIPVANHNYFTDIMKNIDVYLPRQDALVEELYRFAERSSTRANVMRLPARGMQNRGIIARFNGRSQTVEPFFEQMPRTLFECFGNGEFRNKTKGRDYFKSDKEVADFIKKENLDMFFVDDRISKEAIKPLIGRMKANESEWLNDKNELIEMLANFNRILSLRQVRLLNAEVKKHEGRRRVR